MVSSEVHLKDTNAYIQSTTSWIIATRLHVFSYELFEQRMMDTSKREGKERERERERKK